MVILEFVVQFVKIVIFRSNLAQSVWLRGRNLLLPKSFFLISSVQEACLCVNLNQPSDVSI